MALLPTSLKAICWGDEYAEVAMGIADLTISGYDIHHWRTCIPPIDPPITAKSWLIPMEFTSFFWAFTMSLMVITGKSSPYGFLVSWFIDDGPVEPLHPPITFEHIMKYLSVSRHLPGPMIISHQPGFVSPSYQPATCASPESAWHTKIALLFSLLSLP